MKGLSHVFTWEVTRHLRNKQFLIGLLLTPLIFVAFGAIPTLLAYFDRPQQYEYLVVDELGVLDDLRAKLEGSRVALTPHSMDPDALREKVLAGNVNGYFVLDRTFVEQGVLPIYVAKLQMRPDALDNALTDLLQEIRLAERSLDSEVLAYVTARPAFIPTTLDVKGENTIGNLPMAVGFSVLLFFLILGSGSMLFMSALQEKRDRMSEVVLSSIGPDALFAGKIAGHFFLGIVQVVVWLAIGLPVAYFLLDIPLGDYITPSLIPAYAVFTLLGYLLFAAIFVGMGGTMDSMETASNLQGMVFMLPALPFFVIGPIIGNPDGAIARFATLFPLTSPVVTILRSGFTVLRTWEWAVAAVLLLLTTAVIIKMAAKIFRVGMLMYGKNPDLRELIRWLRHA